jgi:hypothetical protein
MWFQAQIGFITVLVRPLVHAWTEANQLGKWDTTATVTSPVITPVSGGQATVNKGIPCLSGQLRLCVFALVCAVSAKGKGWPY